MGADHYTTSLREMVEICVRLTEATRSDNTNALASPHALNNAGIVSAVARGAGTYAGTS